MTDVRKPGREAGTDWVFRRDAIRSFRFVRASMDEASGQAELVYAFDDGPELVETLHIPGAPFQLDAARRSAVAAALRLLHLIAGVSYYKAAVPRELVVEGLPPDPALAALVTSVSSCASSASNSPYNNRRSARNVA